MATKRKYFDFTAAELVAVFASQLGQSEHPRDSNRQKWGAWYGMNGVSYCGIGVNWCFAHVDGGKDLRSIGIATAYTPTFLAKGSQSTYFSRVSRTSIRKGDIVFFDFPDRVFRTQHVGIARSNWSRSGGKTIEFNTSPSSSGSQDNGGGVYGKDRLVAHVSGVLRPHYQLAAKKSVPPKPALTLNPPPTIKVGSTGTFVKSLQRKLHLAQDGVFGPKTKAAVVAFQKRHKLEADGVVGPKTWKALT